MHSDPCCALAPCVLVAVKSAVVAVPALRTRLPLPEQRSAHDRCRRCGEALRASRRGWGATLPRVSFRPAEGGRAVSAGGGVRPQAGGENKEGWGVGACRVPVACKGCPSTALAAAPATVVRPKRARGWGGGGAVRVAEGARRGCDGRLRAYDRSLRAYDRGLRAYGGRLRAYDRGLRAYDRRLRAYDRSLRAYDRSLRAYDKSLRTALSKTSMFGERGGKVR